MATTKQKPSFNKNPKRNPSLGPKKDLKKKQKALTFDKTSPKKDLKKKSKKPKPLTFEKPNEQQYTEPKSASEQLTFFLNQLESSIGVRVSSLELDPIKDKCVVELDESLEQNGSNLGEHVKMCCGESWRETLCEGEVIEGSVECGSPFVLVISVSALRSLELMRGLSLLTKQCPALKLFSKHLKVEEQDLGSDDKIYRYFQRHFGNAEQKYLHVWEVMIRYIDIFRGICNAEQKYLHVSICNADQKYLHVSLIQALDFAFKVLAKLVTLLKKRVNIGSGTPSRIKKLIDIEALGLSRLDMIVLDMHTDVKGFSLFSLPQVRDEFWDLYKNCFHQRVLEGSLRICLYGPKLAALKSKNKKKH